MSQTMEECIRDCLSCYQACTTTVMHCLKLGGDHAQPNHIRILLDCAEICNTSASFLLRDSNHAKELCDTCATVCEICAAECEDMMGSDEQMKQCAEICRVCSASCKNMAQGV